MGSVALLYVFAIGRRLAGPVCGVVAVLLLFTHAPLMLSHGLRTNNMEAPLLLQYTGMVYHYLAWRSAGPRGRGHLMAIALYFVLGFMTKFVAALFAPLVLVLAVALSPDDRRRIATGWRSVGQVAILAAALIAPWFAYRYYAIGPRLFDLMFGEHVMKRFTAFLDPMHVQPWHYYLTELWRHLQTPAARALVVAGTVLILTRAVRRRWIDGILVVLWFVVPVAAMSAGTSKLYHYLYPFLPPVALAGGYAAASIADWAWRLFQQPVEALARARERALPAWSGHRRARAVLTAAGFAALALALATYFAGPLRTTDRAAAASQFQRHPAPRRGSVGGAGRGVRDGDPRDARSGAGRRRAAAERVRVSSQGNEPRFASDDRPASLPGADCRKRRRRRKRRAGCLGRSQVLRSHFLLLSPRPGTVAGPARGIGIGRHGGDALVYARRVRAGHCCPATGSGSLR